MNSGKQGGAIYLYNAGNLIIQNCWFEKNVADFGGAIYYQEIG